MQIGQTTIIDTFAEAFRMRFTRVIVTALDRYWVDAAVREFCGYGSSVIGCDAEVGVERWLSPSETPDGRPGVAVLAFAFSTDALAKAMPKRIGQSVMTCPTTAVFSGLRDAEEQFPLGGHLRFFGDGFQKSKKFAQDRYWRIPVMDGEFLIEDKLGAAKGIAGGNLIVCGRTQEAALLAARRIVEEAAAVVGTITPFPGGVVRSGSKVGSRYKGMVASTNDAFCPTLRGRVETDLPEDAACAYEVVINGVDEESVAAAMRAGLYAAAAIPDVSAVSAGNYGGKLGKFHFHLHQLLQPPETR